MSNLTISKTLCPFLKAKALNKPIRFTKAYSFIEVTTLEEASEFARFLDEANYQSLLITDNYNLTKTCKLAFWLE